jgi:hypothetical protein
MLPIPKEPETIWNKRVDKRDKFHTAQRFETGELAVGNNLEASFRLTRFRVGTLENRDCTLAREFLSFQAANHVL